MEMRKFNLILLFLLLPSLVYAAAPTRSYNYVAHTTIDPSQNNTNENSLYSYLQAGVDTYSSGTLTNDAVSASAAISYSKLNLINSVKNADISSTAAIDYSKLSLTGSIVNADINASAAIVGSKLDLTSPGAIGSTVANTGAFSTLKVGTTHQGDVLYDNGTTFVRLTPGTTGQFLKTQGASANPLWADVTTPGITLKSTTTLSGVSTSGAISLTSGKTYKIYFKLTNATNSTSTTFILNGDSTANYQPQGASSSTQSNFSMGAGAIGSSAGYTGTIDIIPGQTSVEVITRGHYINSGTSVLTDILQATATGVYNAATNATSITFTPSSGNFTGTIWTYEYSGT